MTKARDTAELFLEGAEVVVAAISDPAVAAAWDRPSVLEEQAVSGLAGHLAHGAVWVVADYLDAGPPGGPVDCTSALEYFVTLLGQASPADHEAVRRRGADVAVGHDALVRALAARLAALGPRLRALDAGHPIAVAGGNVMRLDHYLTTRIVEQVVHLDDLARSVDRDPWPVPPAAADLVISIGLDIARRRSGDSTVIRALYRRGFAAYTLPVF